MSNSLNRGWSGFAKINLIGPDYYEFGKVVPITAVPAWQMTSFKSPHELQANINRKGK